MELPYQVTAPKPISSKKEVSEIFERNWGNYFSAVRYKYPNMSNEDINDCISACRLRILKSYHLYNPEVGSSINSWIKVCIFNIIKDDNRKSKTEKKMTDRFGGNDYFRFIELVNKTPDNDFICRDYTNIILSSNSLTIYEKHLIIRLLCGYSYKELVKKMGVPMTTVKAKVLRLRIKCNKIFRTKTWKQQF